MSTEVATRIKVIGIGCGAPDHLTLQAVAALGSLDVVVLADKSKQRRGSDPDPLVQAREAILAAHAPASVERLLVTDPPRERRADRVADHDSYLDAVERWHADRARVYAEALAPYAGRTIGFLVWGDPAFYDSTVRILDRVAGAGIALDVEVLPGISAVQLLAARHHLVLNEIGSDITVTTGRRLRELAGRGADNLVVMLNARFDAADLGADHGDWEIWWGGNLGTTHESLLAGLLRDVAPRIAAERDRLRDQAGWVMDVYLLRRG